jgi:hypothetical protein
MPIKDDFTIDYPNRRIYHSSGTTVYAVNELYSWLMDELDEDTTIDDTIPMTAQTPTAYTLTNSWYLDQHEFNSFEYLYGGSIRTTGWNASAFTLGIRLLTFNQSGYTAAVTSDIGKAVTGGTTAHTGILLDFDNDNRKWWIRTDSLTDTFNLSESITIDSGTGAGTSAAASVTGENVWTNLYTIGTIAAYTQIYIIQNHLNISPWWSDDHIDILLLTREAGSLIDRGYVTVLARQYTKFYDHFVSDLSGGNRTPIPLSTLTDINNTTGFRSFTASGISGTFEAGNYIYTGASWATATAKGALTAVSGSTLTYYPLTDTDFSNGNAITEWTGTSDDATATAGTPSNTGPAALSGITFTFGADSKNLNNGNGLRPYDLVIDCNDSTLQDLYEYLKFVSRNGSTTNLNGYDGEQYSAVGDYYLDYESPTGTFVEGNTLTGSTSGATGIIVSNHTTQEALVVRDVVGTFVVGESITEDSNSATISTGGVQAISPNKQAPFGSFAGGKFFGARGIWLDNVAGADANNYELTDSTNTRQVPPASIAITVTGLESDDQVAVFRATDATNNIVDKSMYTIYETHTAPVAYLRVSGAVPNDTPTSGYIRVVRRQASGTILGEERYAYTGWTNETGYAEFTLSATTTQNYNTTDTTYVPYIDATATGSSVSTSLTYTSNRSLTTRVRKSGILPFTVAGTLTNANLTITAIRAEDTVA